MKNTVEVIKHHVTSGDNFFTLAITDKDGDTHTDVMSEITVKEFLAKGVKINLGAFADFFDERADWEKKADELQEWMDEQELTYSGFGSNSELSYSIEGFTYNLMVSINDDSEWYCETTHKERFKKEDDDIFNPYADTAKAYANKAEPKTLRGVKGYITKWIEA